MKKLSLLMSVVFLMVVLAACGSDANTPQPSSTEKPSEDAVTTDTDNKEEVEVREDVKKDAKKNDSFYVDAFKEDIVFGSEEQLELSQESYDFIKSNSNIFPAKSDEDIEKAKNIAKPIEYRSLSKSVKPYYSTIANVVGEVLLVIEEDHDNDETAALVYVYDDDGNTHVLYIYKGTGDILDGDRVEFYGVPVGGYSYSADDGGFENAQMYFGSHIEKK